MFVSIDADGGLRIERGHVRRKAPVEPVEDGAVAGTDPVEDVAIAPAPTACYIVAGYRLYRRHQPDVVIVETLP